MSTIETGFAPDTANFTVGDVLSLRLPVGAPGADGLPLPRLAVVASVGDYLGEAIYEIVPAAIGDDLPARETDIAARLGGKDGAETRLVPNLALKVCASAPMLADSHARLGRLPAAAHAALVADTARRAASRAAHLAARRKRAASRYARKSRSGSRAARL